jgi:small subunit ribosomal protein S1
MQQTGEVSFYGEGSHSSPAVAQNLMEEWLDRAGDVVDVQRGDIVDGVIVSVAPTEILIDVGCKCDGLISGRELERMSPDELDELCVGECIPVFVVNPEDKDGNIILSINRARAERDWRLAEALFESGDLYSGQVSGCNKGGVIVNVGQLRGFVPASQLETRSSGQARDASPRDDDARWEHLIGCDLKLKVIELDRNRNRLILSERAAGREWRQAARKKLMEELRVGDVRSGIVNSICEFGAFVDLGGADGLVHLSELSWNRVGHPREVVHVGQKVDVQVLDIDKDKQRIGLSIRRLVSEPWDDMADGVEVGQVVDGTITKIVEFGAFARIGEHVEGLIHISELSESRINHPQEVVQEGEVWPLKIIRIDADQRRIGLSLKQAHVDSDDWEDELEDDLEEDESAEDV